MDFVTLFALFNEYVRSNSTSFTEFLRTYNAAVRSASDVESVRADKNNLNRLSRNDLENLVNSTVVNQDGLQERKNDVIDDLAGGLNEATKGKYAELLRYLANRWTGENRPRNKQGNVISLQRYLQPIYEAMIAKRIYLGLNKNDEAKIAQLIQENSPQMKEKTRLQKVGWKSKLASFAKKVLLPATIVGLVGAAAGVGLAFSGLTAGASVFWSGSLISTIRTLASIGLVGGFGLTVGGLIAGNQITKAIHRRALNKHKGWTNEEVLQTLNGDYSYENIKSLTNLPVNAFINKIIETQNKIRNSHNPIANYFRRRRNRNRLHSLASFEDKLRNSKNADTDKVGVTNALLNYIEEFRQTNLENSYARRLLTGKKVFEDADIYGKHNPNLGTRKNVKKDKEAVYSRVRELMPKFVESHIFGNGNSDTLNYEQLGVDKSKIINVYNPNATVSYKNELYRPLTKKEKKPLLKRIREIDDAEARTTRTQANQQTESTIQTLGKGLNSNSDKKIKTKPAKKLRKISSINHDEEVKEENTTNTISTFGLGKKVVQTPTKTSQPQGQVELDDDPNLVQRPSDKTIPKFAREKHKQQKNVIHLTPSEEAVDYTIQRLLEKSNEENKNNARTKHGKTIDLGQPSEEAVDYTIQRLLEKSNKENKNNSQTINNIIPTQPVKPVQQNEQPPVETEKSDNKSKTPVFSSLMNGAQNALKKGEQSKSKQPVSDQQSITYTYNGSEQSYFDSLSSEEVESSVTSQSITYQGQTDNTTKKANTTKKNIVTPIPVKGEPNKYYIGKNNNIKADKLQGTNYYVDEKGNVLYPSGGLVPEKKLVNIRVPGKDNGDTLTVTAVDKDGKTYQGTVSRRNSNAKPINNNDVDNSNDTLKP